MRTDSIFRILGLCSLRLAAAAEPEPGFQPVDRDTPAEIAAKLSGCPGYVASSVKTTSSSVKADLRLAGEPCNAYGNDLDDLKLDVTVESSKRIHVKIYDAAEKVYQVPESVFPRPQATGVDQADAALKFDFTENPFSFRISRTESNEVLFDSSAAALVFEDQYLRLRTRLPDDANLYGLGEHSDSFRLRTTNYTATLWNADKPSIPEGNNLYGSHPVYIEHRTTGSHGVFLLNSNGMDVKIDKDAEDGSQYLEYNTLGGVLDFYFTAGPSPVEVAKQYAEIAGYPVTAPYSSLGLHQCRWGYQDAYEIAEVIYNYTQAGIPLETMWIDIDYMEGRSVFSLDPERFPYHMVREITDHLHQNKQKFTMMVDPAVAAKDYPPYNEGVDANIFLRNEWQEIFYGVVWPGLTAYPDWFSKGSVDYWTKQFAAFFDRDVGVDIDFLWIDMNEPANFCPFPCLDVHEVAKDYPPQPPAVRSPPRPLPGWSCDFQPEGTGCQRVEEQPRLSYGNKTLEFTSNGIHVNGTPKGAENLDGHWKGLPGRELIFPPYAINNTWGPLPHKSINTSLIHQNGLTLFDTHNLYGAMMSAASREAMIARRPTKRPFVITRSTFAGAGSHVAHWLGDNDSAWPHYHYSIRGMMQFNSIFQVAMVGSDVCGFNHNTTEELCARWAMLGAFQPFYRNHNAEGEISQEFYRWNTVAEAARKAIDIRYRLLDYFYTALMLQSYDGTPAINPMFYIYPEDKGTFGLDFQFFYGPSLLIAPVTSEGATSVDVYLPNDIFYDFYTHEQILGEAKTITKTNQGLTDIPLFLRGGIIVPLRIKSAMTTSELREQDFELLIPLDKDGNANGTLYLDDGESLNSDATSSIKFTYVNGTLSITGSFGYQTKVMLAKVTVLGGGGGREMNATRSMQVQRPLTEAFFVTLK